MVRVGLEPVTSGLQVRRPNHSATLPPLLYDLLTDPLGGSSLLNYLQILLNYINYNYKIDQIMLFTNYTVETALTESSYSKID